MATSFGEGLREGLVGEPSSRGPLKVIEGGGHGTKRKRPKLQLFKGGLR
jgi:hypothetical protein